MTNNYAIPAVGGPAHGGFYHQDGSRMTAASSPLSELEIGLPATVGTVGEYRREKMSTVYGSLRLEGEAWIWSRITLAEARGLAFGLLVGAALR